MGKPSEQIACDDWTASFVLDEAALSFGGWVDNEVKRYAAHTPESSTSKKQGKPPTLAHVIEYQRALVEGTLFRRIIPKKRLPTGRQRSKSEVDEKPGERDGNASTG